MPPVEAQRLAAEYAQHRGARLLRLDGDLNMVTFTRERVNQLVSQTIEQGDSLQALQKALREDLAFSRERARTVARTETATAQGQGAKGAAIVQGRDEKHWVTQGDDAVEGDCLENEAAGWTDIGQPFPTGVDTIPQHPNCLLGDSRVLAQGITAAVKRWYQGEVIVLRTASANKLSCTPNHPILTSDGWRAAGVLHEGDYVISSLSVQGMPLSYDYDDLMPATIEKVADTFRQSLGVSTCPVPLSPEDFHGDGVGSEIAIVWSNGLLWDGDQSTLQQQGAKTGFQRGAGRLPKLTALGRFDQRLQRHSAANRRLVGSGDLMEPLVMGHAAPFQRFGLASVTESGPCLSQSGGNGITGYAVPRSQDIHRIAGEIFCDQVVEIIRVPFSGHVYNLETRDGFYIAESIITHNCRCVVRYRTTPSSDVVASRQTARAITEARCPTCNKLLGKNLIAGQLFCTRCKKEVVFPAAL